jgi:F0F1-type ATP synthase assembly protein I
MADTPDHKNPEQKRQNNVKPYVKYSGMAFQMIGALVIAAYAGMKLDDYAGNENPWFTVALLLIAVIATTVLTIVSITKNK